MDAPGEIWQVMVNGEVYEADLETIKQWIVEGAVQPGDKVRRGRLNWIDAARVPVLRPAFGGADVPPPSYSSTPPGYGSEPYGAAQGSHDSGAAHPPYGAAPAFGAPKGGAGYGHAATSFAGLACHNHPTAAATHACVSCGAGFCKPCRKLVNNVTLCTVCGHFCKPVEEIRQKVSLASDQGSGFGLNDLARAIMYPLANPVGLAVMTIVFGMLLLLGWRGQFVAMALTLSCMSVAINRISMGRFEEGFVPDISGGIFDIFVSPLKLAVAISLIVFGPIVVALYLGIEAGISSFGRGELASGQIGVALVLLLVGALWAAFYYPMALLVAGFTGSFLATINPIVGFDTIWRMGFDYAKAYGMCVVAAIIQFGLAYMFHQLTITDSRSIPAAAMVFVGFVLQGGSSFYAYMVVAAILGQALFKCADKLDLGMAGR